MAKSGGNATETISTGLDPATAEWVRKIYGAASTASKTPGQGIDPNSVNAGKFYNNGVQGGNLGFGALGGDPASYAALNNPYLKEVLNRVQGDQSRLNAGTINSVNDAATKAGAFGGSRHGVAEGVALADVNRTAADRMADLRSQGFNETMARAGNLANLGLGSAPGLAGYGDYRRNIAEGNNPAMREASVLKNFLSGLPSGQTSTRSTPLKGTGAGDILGGAAGLGGLFAKLFPGGEGSAGGGGWGALLGGLLPLLV